jgi:hypothetical protein
MFSKTYLRYLGSLFSKIYFPHNSPPSLASLPRRLGLQKYYLFLNLPNVFKTFLPITSLNNCKPLRKIFKALLRFIIFWSGLGEFLGVMVENLRWFYQVDDVLSRVLV